MAGRSNEDRARSARLCEEAARAGLGPHTPKRARREQVLRLKRAGATYRDIAELFGISEQAVQQAGTVTRRLSQAEWQLVQEIRSGNTADARSHTERLARQAFREKI